MVPIETAGTAREVAEKVKQGKAFLKIVDTPWGVEFYIGERGARAKSPPSERRSVLPPLTQLLFASVKAGRETKGSPRPGATISNQLSPGKFSFAALAILCVVSNFIAFVVSSGLRSNYVELDPSVQPGSLLSLGMTEGIILAVSVSLFVLIHDAAERTVLLGLVSGFFAADAVNDVVLVSTGSMYLAMELAWITAVAIPSVVGISLLRMSRRQLR